MPGLQRSRGAGQVPLHRQTSVPVPTTGRALPAQVGAAASGELAGFAHGLEVLQSSAEPDEHVHRADPCHGAYVEEGLAVKVVPWVWGASSWLSLGDRVNNKIPDASASLAAPPSVKPKAFPPLPYLGVDLLGLGAP